MYFFCYVNCIETQKDIIECKETNTAKLSLKKNDAWSKVAELFNNHSCVTPRTKDLLRLRYKNIKANSRKRIFSEKVEVFATGGGKKKVQASELDARLKATGAIVQPLLNPFDSDYLLTISRFYCILSHYF